MHMALHWKNKWGIFRIKGDAPAEVRFGEQANTDGSGMAVSSSRTAIVRLHTDTGGATTTGNLRGFLSRMLIGTAQTAMGTLSSICGQVKAVANVTGSWASGVWGYFESSGTLTLTPGNAVCGVRATVDVPSGGTIASGKIAAALVCDSIDLGGTHTGIAAHIYARDAAAGAFDGLLALDASSEVLTTEKTGGTPAYIKVYIGGVLYTIKADTTA
jgi:hypothetical protein